MQPVSESRFVLHHVTRMIRRLHPGLLTKSWCLGAVLYPFVFTPSVCLFEMVSDPAPAPRSSSKWHCEQKKVFMKLLCDLMFMPIGGEGDGQMERKVERRWGPLLAVFKSENAKLARSVLQIHSGMRLKSDFNEKALQQKYQLSRQKYDEMKKRQKVGRQQLRGETGSAAEGQARQHARGH
jgi:hypothetical protein